MAEKRGGKRAGAGRPKGARTRATKEMKTTLAELAREHTATALQVLVQVATSSESDAARVSAATAILDRGYGKPVQSVEHGGENGGPIPIQFIAPGQYTEDAWERLQKSSG